MEYVASTIAGHDHWVLLDEQYVVFEKIRAAVAAGVAGAKQQVILVKGGGGAGNRQVGARHQPARSLSKRGAYRTLRNWLSRVYQHTVEVGRESSQAAFQVFQQLS